MGRAGAALAAAAVVAFGGAGFAAEKARPAGASPQGLIAEAAGAMGGRAKVMGVKSLRQYAYGQTAYQDGGGNISSSPRAPQKTASFTGQVRTIDYEHGRMRMTQRQVQDFVFASRANMDGTNRPDQRLDGAVAFNVRPDGTAQRVSNAAARVRRIEMLDNPLSIVRAGLRSGARLGPVRMIGAEPAVDLTTAEGDTVTVAFDPRTHLPAWMSWVAPHPNFGDVTYRTYFTGYQPFDGLTLPSGYSTTSDFRGLIQNKTYVDRYEVDAAPGDLAAPAAVAAAAAPPDFPVPTIEAKQVAPHVWYLHSSINGSSTAFEFKDHVTLFEAYGSEQNLEATLKKVREVITGKPITQLVVSHHHIDHTGGLRAAVAEGLTVITNRGDNAAYVREVTGRPAARFPDLLQKKGRVGKAVVVPVDDKLVLKDDTLEVDVFRVRNNSHYAEGLFAYIPSAKAVVQGDLIDEGWDLYWWGNTYPDSVKARGIAVEQDLPVHGHIHTYAEVLDLIGKQAKAAEAFCAKAEADRFNVQGCPVGFPFTP